MATIKQYSDREIKSILADNGFVVKSKKGDHVKYRKGNRTLVVNKGCNKMVFRRVCRENGIDVR